MTRFQLILTGVFGLLLIGGVIIFSTYKGSSKDAVKVLVWGTLPQNVFTDIVRNTSLNESKEFVVEYVEKKEESFDQEFLEALASGNGPDLFMLPSDKILKHQNKIFPIPYDVYTERQFKDNFIEGAEIYLTPKGPLALPIFVDPLVMYWNRSLFTAANLTLPPKYWDEFYSLAGLLSKKDGALNISKSLVAFGEFLNIKNAKEIIVNLTMQAGNPIIVWSGDKPVSVFDFNFEKPSSPAEAAVNFYTEFANPSKPSYSWNRSLPNSQSYFLGGDLALYFGFASEIGDLQFKNPNLNFDVARVPVSREGGNNVSYARFEALAITKASPRISAAFSVANILTGEAGAAAFSRETKLPSARRDLLAKKGENAAQIVFNESAIRAKSWLDPDPDFSDNLFKVMVESITSGRSRTAEAVVKVSRDLNNLLSK